MDQHGFTLIELVVVVLIIGVLASIAVPHLASAWDDAKASACKANMKQIEAALELYYFEHGEYPTETNFTAENLKLKSAPTCPQSKQNESSYTYTPAPTNNKNMGYTLKCNIHHFTITETAENFNPSSSAQ
ncbi:MAG: prepilin-type N-terminal cleavage/methylation domain-containing protein [Firmicutes bacterium]|nr:prepilin-type N-terminal cleavage/methylation domain-containing protein [Bacillota bacterium]